MTRAAFDSLPQAIVRRATVETLAGVPCLLIPPEPDCLIGSGPAPMLVWMHGRTACKELDPGRYLRLMRSGIAVCAVDLPGHGDRREESLQDPSRVVDVVLQMVQELDALTWAATDRLNVDASRVAIGGMSAGGMAAISRLCTPHRFKAAILEATTGDWTTLTAWAHLDADARQRAAKADPMQHLEQWPPLPVCAVHSRADAWIPFDGQRCFLELLRGRGCTIELTAFDQTGAPFEHVGFGRYAAQVKEVQRDFLVRTLAPSEGTQ